LPENKLESENASLRSQGKGRKAERHEPEPMKSFDQWRAALPGGISVTHLRVYNTEGPDGLRGGSPHLHFACSEAYFVIAGEGAVQTLCQNGFRELALRTGSVVWFTPGLMR
jgi:mannose-6-phosphate isomerase-like protein (cupin superfamily)